MRKKRVLLYAGLAVVVLIATAAGCTLYVLYSIRNTPIFTKEQEKQVEITIKGIGGQMLFLDLSGKQKKDHPARVDGIITEYQRDPKKFKHYAELYDTVTNATHIGETVEGNPAAFSLPISSSDLPLPLSAKLDPWGHPYCISAVKGTIAVVSGGPDAISYSCASQRVPVKEITSATRNVFQTKDGEVVTLINQEHTKRKTPTS